ncbi:MAG: hypothetical protein HOV68_11935 [Streptomycetaceae bacterium]|nr:hypothetical protein [Streptomycetaceae bacterium]
MNDFHDFPRPRTPRPRAEAPLPTSSPFECWVDIPAQLRRYDQMTGVQRAHALADWIEDVGAMNLATELLRTREVMASLMRLLKDRGIPLPAEKKAEDAQPPDAHVPEARVPDEADADRPAAAT